MTSTNSGSIRFCFLSLLIVSLVWQAANVAAEHQDPRIEPPLMIELNLAGKTTVIPLGVATAIEVEGKQIPIRMQAVPHRLLGMNDYSFKYPSYFAFEFEKSTDVVDFWSLDGNTAVVMISRYPSSLGDLTANFVQEFVGQYGKEKVVLSDTKITLDGKEVSGKLLTVNLIPGVVLTQSVFGIESKKHRYALVLQDTLDDNGQHTAEYQKAVKMLTESFTWQQ